jgi:hypothetical protein
MENINSDLENTNPDLENTNPEYINSIIENKFNTLCPRSDAVAGERQKALDLLKNLTPEFKKEVDNEIEEYYKLHKKNFAPALAEINKRKLVAGGMKKSKRNKRKGGEGPDAASSFQIGSAKCHLWCILFILSLSGISMAVLYNTYTGVLASLTEQLRQVSGQSALCSMESATRLVSDQLAKNALGSSCTDAVTEFASKMAKIYTALEKNRNWFEGWSWKIALSMPAGYAALYKNINNFVKCDDTPASGGKRKNRRITKKNKTKKSKR